MTAQRTLWIVLGIAGLLRVIFLADVLRHPLMSEFVILDSEAYASLAARVTEGDWLLGKDPYPFGPLYIYFLALMRTLVGENAIAIFVVQALVGLANIVLTAAIARRCFDARVAVAAAALMTLYGRFAHLETKLLSTTLAIFLVLSATALSLRARDAGWRAGWLLPGMVFGLACLARPNTILFTPVLALWLLWDQRRWAPVLAVSVGVLLGVLPVTARNYAVSGEFTLISSQGGVVFAQSHNPRSKGVYLPATPEFSGDPLEQAREQVAVAERRTGRKLTTAEASTYWFHQGVDFILENPGDALVLQLRKLALWLGSSESSAQYVLTMERELTPALWLMPLPFGVLLGLAFLGLRREREDDGVLLLYLFILLNIATVVVFYFESRYRLPAVPFVCVIAGAGAVEIIDRVRERRTDVALWLAPAVVIAALSVYPWTRATYFQGADEYFNLGNEYKERERYREAVASYRKSLERREDYWRVHVNLAIALFHAGEFAESAQHYERVLELHPNWENRAQVERLLRRSREHARGRGAPENP
jgi:4-amino-4-deoxy-L-arabinose transferase-like glycosyltransferase